MSRKISIHRSPDIPYLSANKEYIAIRDFTQKRTNPTHNYAGSVLRCAYVPIVGRVKYLDSLDMRCGVLTYMRAIADVAVGKQRQWGLLAPS